MRILLVEDDATVCRSLQETLQAEGIICDTAMAGLDGVELSKIYDYDLILLDMMLPDVTGYDVIKKLRANSNNTPICIISARGEADQKIKGLGLGADDYVTKPFNKSELLARMQAIVRRSQGHGASIIRNGKMCVNMKEKIVTIDNKVVNLTPKEYSILELLALRKGATLTKEMFLNHLYGGIDEPELKIIDVFICKLRRKLARLLGDENCIETVWGRGYILRDPAVHAELEEDNINFQKAHIAQSVMNMG